MEAGPSSRPTRFVSGLAPHRNRGPRRGVRADGTSYPGEHSWLGVEDAVPVSPDRHGRSASGVFGRPCGEPRLGDSKNREWGSQARGSCCVSPVVRGSTLVSRVAVIDLCQRCQTFVKSGGSLRRPGRAAPPSAGQGSRAQICRAGAIPVTWRKCEVSFRTERGAPQGLRCMPAPVARRSATQASSMRQRSASK